MTTKRDYRSFDFLLAILVVCLAVLGIVLIGSATNIHSGAMTSEFKGQIIWVVTGIIIMLAAAFIDYQFICKFYIPAYLINIFLLILVLLVGRFITHDYPYRSIPIPKLGTIQPSEFNKLFMLIFLARFIDSQREKINHPLVLLIIFALTGVPLILVQLQPSLSASLVTAVIMIVMLFVTKLHYRYFVIGLAIILPIGLILLYDVSSASVITTPTQVEEVTYDSGSAEPILTSKTIQVVTVEYDPASAAPILIDKIMSPYQIKRLKTFLHPEEDQSSDADYQNRQAMMAIGSGQLSGKGLFGREVYVPEAQNDFIFTVLAEEFGFIGCIITLTIILIIVFRCMIIAQKADIFYGKLLAGAVGGMIAFQTFANVGVNTGILPNTGMIFPFISSGGSAMWVLMACIGLVLNVGMTRTKSMFED